MSDERTYDEFDISKIETLVDGIEQSGEWSVDDWDLSGGLDDIFTVSIDIRYLPPEQRGDVDSRQAMQVIREIDDGEGLDKDELHEELRGRGIAPKSLDKLRQRGEIYDVDGEIKQT